MKVRIFYRNEHADLEEWEDITLPQGAELRLVLDNYPKPCECCAPAAFVLPSGPMVHYSDLN